MPSRQPAASSDDEDEKSTSASKRELPTLTGLENYDLWWSKVEDYFYKKGKAWDKMLAQAKKREATEEQDPNPKTAANDIKQRRAAWGVIKDSISAEEAKKYRGIEQGRVEALIRAIRATYNKKSEAALDALTKKLITLTLNDYSDLEAYIAEANIIFSNLEAQGEGLSEGRKAFYLLEGLPGDYEMAKNTLRMPNVSNTYKQVCEYLQQWIETRPHCPGYSGNDPKRGRGRKRDRVMYATEQSKYPGSGAAKDAAPLCKNFQKTGSCKWGQKCKFRHEQRPGKSGGSDHRQDKRGGSDRQQKRKCYGCGSETHLLPDCPKKGKQEGTRRSPRLAKNKMEHAQRAFAAFLKECYSGSDSDSASEASPAKKPKKKKPMKAKKKKGGLGESVYTAFVREKVYKAARSGGRSMRHRTIIDGGSTCSITTEFDDCIDIKPCREFITVGGKKGKNQLLCKWKGTRVLQQADTRGDAERLLIKDTRIMPKFGAKVIPEHIFLRRAQMQDNQG